MPRLPSDPALKAKRRALLLRSAAVVLVLGAVLLELFSLWGLNTAAGRSAFDEMAGIIPLAAAPLGLLLLLCALGLWYWERRRAMARRKAEADHHG